VGQINNITLDLKLIGDAAAGEANFIIELYGLSQANNVLIGPSPREF